MEVPSLPPASVRALLRHYQQAAREDASFHARAKGSWILGADGRPPHSLGFVNRTAHHVLAGLGTATARRWRADWHAYGLLRPSGREAFTGCVLLPLIPLRHGTVAVAALPSAALADPRAIAVRTTGPGWTEILSGHGWRSGLLYACSDPFEALVLSSAGLSALALVDEHARATRYRGLTTRLRRLRPRRLVLVCAATIEGEHVSDCWRDLAAAAGIPVDARALPAGCTLRDVAHLAYSDSGAVLHELVSSRTPARPLPPSQSARAALRIDPWAADGSRLAADFSTYVGGLRSTGRSRDDCWSIAGYLARLWRFCDAEGVKSTAAIRRHHLEQFQAVLTAKAAHESGMSRGALARTIAAARGFLRWAVASSRSRRDLVTVLVAVRRPASVPPGVLGTREIERALAGIPHRRPVGLRDRTMLEVLYATGIRRSELVGVDLADVDATGGTLRVRRGKGGTSRLVPLTRRALAWLQRYVERARPLHLIDPREPALFISRRGRRLTPKKVTDRMHACWVAAGLAHAGSCHVVRHSVATLMHDRGADIRDLQALLGHALLTSTQLYTRVSMQRLQEVHRRTHPGAGDNPRALPPP